MEKEEPIIDQNEKLINDSVIDAREEAKKYSLSDAIDAHKYSSNHMRQLKKDKVCGCFYCLKVFSPNDIKMWIRGESGDKLGTAICPYCGIDSVIGESSGYPITKGFY